MFNRSPFKDAEVNPEPPQLDLQDRINLTIGFLWFHRRIIIALILIGGFGFWIYRTTTTPRERELPEVSVFQKPGLDELPSASLEFVPESGKTSANENKVTIDSSNSTVNPPQEPSSNQQDALLETGTASELIEESLNIRDKVGANSSVVDFMLCSKRAKICRRLMEMEISPTQRNFALTSYIESISMLDSLNVQGRLDIAGPRAALLEVGEKYSSHPDLNVSRKANLAVLLAPAYDFLTTGDPELLLQFQREFDARVDKIIDDRQAASRVIVTATFVNDKAGFESLTWPVCLHILERFEKSSSSDIENLASGFRERLYYGKLDSNSLADRIQDDDSRSRDDVQKFFEALAINPDSRRDVYMIAIAVIKKYQELGRQSEAQALVARLREICGKMTTEDQRAKVLEAIDELEE